MQCENCGQRPATIHQTIIMNGAKQQSHLCEVCARERHQEDFLGQGNFSFPNLSIQQLLNSFLGQDFVTTPPIQQRQAEPHCPTCGMTYSEFVDSGRLGCAQCYESLDPQLSPLIKRIQGTTQHTGKAPKRTGGVLRKRRELASHKQQLQEAVVRENFEEAARLRDRIKEMEGELQAGGSSSAVE